ncbi:hypothetical protein [Jiulongibacter sp. NS-SX5]|uniref:hypothetical protein n=1 Tax=Jiulongibacter sp. NS-SX5 TaxID=3463854 RepID=UPI004058F26F
MKKIFLLTSLCFVTLLSNAQLIVNNGDEASDNFFLRVYEAQTRQINSDGLDPSIEGTPLVYDEYQMAEVYTKNGDVKNMPMNYNSHKDVFYFKLRDSNYELDPSEMIDLVKIKNHVYVVKNYEKDNQKTRGFLQLLVMGDYRLMAKKETKFRPEQAPRALETKPMPAKYITLKDKYFLETPEGEIIEVSNGKDVIKVTGVNKLAGEAKNRRISIKKSEHLVPLVQLLNDMNKAKS